MSKREQKRLAKAERDKAKAEKGEKKAKFRFELDDPNEYDRKARRERRFASQGRDVPVSFCLFVVLNVSLRFRAESSGRFESG